MAGFASVNVENYQTEEYGLLLTEVFGIINDEAYNFKVSRVCIDELNAIFEAWREQTSLIKSRWELKKIHCEVFQDLYKLSIFPRSINMKDIEQVYSDSEIDGVILAGDNEIFENFNCFIWGKTNHTYFVTGADNFPLIWDIAYYILDRLPESLARGLGLVMGFFWYLYLRSRVRRKVVLGFGDFFSDPYEPSFHPAVGWVWTEGDNGVIGWDGSYYGNLGWKEFFIFWDTFIGGVNFTGVRMKFLNPIFMQSYYFGRVDRVKVSDTWRP
jgi:hypothetical protein